MAESKASEQVETTSDTVVHATASPPYHVKGEVVEPAGQLAVPARAPAPTNPAQWMHERLVHQIIEFEKGIGPDHEVGGRFVEGPGSDPLHITNLASWGPDMILFMGQYADGRKFELIQHYSQVSVLLMAVPKAANSKPRRIGFELLKNFKDQPHPWGDPVS
jgi:hypothetical protein